MADKIGKFDRRQFMLLGASAAAGLSVSTSAFAQTERPGTPPDKPKGQVIAALSQEPTVFHPLMPAIEVDQGVWWQVFSQLWFIDPDGNFVPDLAREIPTIENGGLSADGGQPAPVEAAVGRVGGGYPRRPPHPVPVARRPQPLQGS